MCRTGKQHLATDELSFVSAIDAVTGPIDLVLASGSLQYVENPLLTFHALSSLAPFVIVDRLPLTISERDRLVLQKVPPWLYRATYPAWFLSQRTWERETKDRVVLSWDGEERVQIDAEEITYRGFVIRTSES